MQPKIILHIPHASTVIPTYEGYIVDQQLLQQEIIKITDWYTDDLFYSDDDILVVAPFSRLFCDAERFSDDAHEVMADVGMGVLYEKNDAGLNIREVSPALRTHILNNYYWEHHKQLSLAVEDQLKQFGKALIIDCHSYPSKPLLRDLHQG